MVRWLFSDSIGKNTRIIAERLESRETYHLFVSKLLFEKSIMVWLLFFQLTLHNTRLVVWGKVFLNFFTKAVSVEETSSQKADLISEFSESGLWSLLIRFLSELEWFKKLVSQKWIGDHKFVHTVKTGHLHIFFSEIVFRRFRNTYWIKTCF